jgi:hypothetical protein
MSENPQTSPGHAGGHEKRDANVRDLTLFAVFMFLTLVVVLIAMWGVSRYFSRHQTLGPPASPFAQGRPMPAPGQPRLQVFPRQDLQHMLAQQNEILNTYGWVDPKRGIVRIPIDRAMDLLLQRGLPVRGSKPAGKAIEDNQNLASAKTEMGQQ